MERYNQGLLLSQRIADERRAGAGGSQHISYADDIMPDFPADLQKLHQQAAAAAQEVQQLHLAVAGPAGRHAPELALSTGGGLASQPAAYALHESIRSEGGFGGGASSSQSSWTQQGRLCQAEYSSASSCMAGPAEVPMPKLRRRQTLCLRCAV